MAAWVRSRRPRLVRMRLTWVLMVYSTTSRSLISAFGRPLAMSARTSVSRSVSSSTAFSGRPPAPRAGRNGRTGGGRCAVMSSGNPLADKGPLTLADLADQAVIGWSGEVPKVFRDFWVRRQWADNGLLGDDGGRLMVVRGVERLG